jgi:anti-anti-sigma factor
MDTTHVAPPAGPEPGWTGWNDDFSVVAADSARGARIWVSGELDLATCDMLAEALYPRLVAGHSVVLECGGLTFTDACGLRVFLAGAKRAEAAGADFAIANLSRQPLYVVTLVGLRATLPLRWDEVPLPR